MSLGEMNVLEVVAAFEQPLKSLDLWLQWATRESAQRLQKAVDAIGAGDPVNAATARLVLGWGKSELTVSAIAKQAGINSSAVSQRKNRIERILSELFHDPTLRKHPLAEIWDDRASRCVRVSDLPYWMSGFLSSGDDSRAWGTPEDIFWVSLHAVMLRPRLIQHQDEHWLVDLTLDTRADNKGTLRSILDSVADVLTPEDSVVLPFEVFRKSLKDVGVSRLSLDSFAQALCVLARRALVMKDQVLVLSDQHSRNLGLIAKQAIEQLRVDRTVVSELIAQQHGRSSKSVSNELRKL